jgi:hypothetical protein
VKGFTDIGIKFWFWDAENTLQGGYKAGSRRFYLDESAKLETNGGFRYIPLTSNLRNVKIHEIGIETLKTRILLKLAHENGGLPRDLIERDDVVGHVKRIVSAIVDLAPQPSDTTCILCFECDADSIVIPCGHTGMCEKCIDGWYIKNQSCPSCGTLMRCSLKL